jgi:hypothetical protein|tara:strand:- start:237 stop:1721 length:1485 start_codon:yes stop_codon:yes gene_type:complete
MGSVLNLLYEEYYYRKDTRSLYRKSRRIPSHLRKSGNDKRFPFPNGFNDELRKDLRLMMEYYESENLGTNLRNSVFDSSCYGKVDSLMKKKRIPIPQVKMNFPFLTRWLCKSFDLKYIDLSKDDLTEDLYFYVIEPLDMDFGRVKKYYDKDIDEVINGEPEDIFDNISPEVIRLINEGRCKIIVDYGHEGQWTSEVFHKWYDDLVAKNVIDVSQIYFFICDLNYEAKMDSRVKINFIPSVFYFELLSREVKGMKDEPTNLGYTYTCPQIKDIDLNKKNKHFLCLQRNCGKSHRRALGTYFQYHDLWDKNILSFLKGNWNWNLDEDCTPKKYQPMLKVLDKMDPIELDTQQEKNKFGFSPMHTNRGDFYGETFLSVVSEAVYTGTEMFFTEKLLKPIWNLHPFILVSTPYCLKKLQEFGFKTFHPFINESYDSIEDDLERMGAIFTELDKFKEKTVDELREWYKDILPILEYNQNHFFDFGKKEPRQITFFKEWI